MGNPQLDYSGLTVAERIQLAEDLWDSVSDAPEVLDLTDAQRAELDRRLAEHEAGSGATIRWSVLRKELLKGT